MFSCQSPQGFHREVSKVQTYLLKRWHSKMTDRTHRPAAQ